MNARPPTALSILVVALLSAYAATLGLASLVPGIHPPASWIGESSASALNEVHRGAKRSLNRVGLTAGLDVFRGVHRSESVLHRHRLVLVDLSTGERLAEPFVTIDSTIRLRNHPHETFLLRTLIEMDSKNTRAHQGISRLKPEVTRLQKSIGHQIAWSEECRGRGLRELGLYWEMEWRTLDGTAQFRPKMLMRWHRSQGGTQVEAVWSPTKEQVRVLLGEEASR